MKAWAIVGYTYQAEIVCPDCMHGIAVEMGGCESLDTETLLDAIAESRGMDRYEERSFDSDEFPKVIFASEIENDEACGRCGNPLIG